MKIFTIICVFIFFGFLAFTTLSNEEVEGQPQKTVSKVAVIVDQAARDCSSFCDTIGYKFVKYALDINSCVCEDPEGCLLHGTRVVTEKIERVGGMTDKYIMETHITNITQLPCKTK